MSPMTLVFFLGYDYPLVSPLYLTLAIAYFLVASITSFDVRLVQSKAFGGDVKQLPTWVGGLHLLESGLLIVLIVLNWRVAIGLLILKLILKPLRVLEKIGKRLVASLDSKARR